ncbi:3-hydroxyacyl-CoA dehydrogenase family protein [Sphingosinicella microcystinivorans]|uniref:3-hydroxyacyl-CoA dehydrogenase n=1 Tax=Sphingosinicella microcystinivorans TaxID=335406 RepID=A0AAD1D6Y0_SPHMI|nr:3-hydroxyacyl-CoA dehydrogenase family protein [Sphingosinicella microcystinivorans]RKS91773.1 3-hydroxyacyl-CoA dehydrogenase [Sphingosinicella microcystinivorans]BBE34759.1 3-hydroxyacyl-CoA dehydrogenase family protein [Sphingosinicella microcystinivorans]
MAKQTIAVIGGGLMGAGIAQTFAAAGHRVTVCEPFDEVRATLIGRVRQGLAQVGDDPACTENIVATSDLVTAVQDASFVTEAAPEKLELKRSIFADLVAHAPRDAVLASNSSVMPIGSITEGLETAERMVGTHWWNPAALIPLVEVIQGERTSLETVDFTMRLLTSAGKKPAHVKKDVAGFVANRLQHALWREAISMVADGICDARTVDDCVKNSFGLRLAVLGPLENADLVGLDLTRDIHRTIIPELNRDAAPSELLDEMIKQGRLGFKSGEGFQRWSADEQAALRGRLVQHLVKARGRD